MALTVRPATGIRRLPLPVCEPPFDDEREQPPDRAQGTLALDFTLPGGLPAVPEPQLRLLDQAPRPAGGPAHRPESDLDAFCARQPTPTSDLPDPRAWVARLAQGLVEVLTGERPPHQLARWTDETLLKDVTARARVAARRRAAARAAGSVPRGRIAVRSVQLCEPADGVVEATALVQAGSRVRALVLRLEGLDGRWRATVARLV